MGIIILGLFFVFFLIVLYLYYKNRKLAKQISILNKIIEAKDTSISNLEASRISVIDIRENISEDKLEEVSIHVSKNISEHDKVMALVEEGESKENIAKKLGIHISKIELIIKFDKIQNVK